MFTTYYKVLYNNQINNFLIGHNIALRNKLKQFKDFYCCGGITMLRIFPTGKYNGGVCNVFPIIGNVYEDDDIDFYKLSSPVKCNLQSCGCDANDKINKYRNIYEAKQYVSKYRAKNIDLILPYLFENLDNIDDKVSNIDNRVSKLINKLAWFIPFRNKRDKFRNDLY